VVDIDEALYTTRALRRLKPDPIPYDAQARILDAAMRAPNIDQRSAMLAARAEGIGSTFTGILQAFCAEEVFDMLGAPKDEEWYLHGVVPMGCPLGKWGVGAREPVQEVAARNSWQGGLGLTLNAPLRQR
jgi:nitroreductase